MSEVQQASMLRLSEVQQASMLRPMLFLRCYINNLDNNIRAIPEINVWGTGSNFFTDDFFLLIELNLIDNSITTTIKN